MVGENILSDWDACFPKRTSSIVYSLLGSDIKKVEVGKRPDLGWENHAVAEMEYKNGVFAYRKFLNAFDDFSITGAHKEFEILENILNSTATLLADFDIQPKSEPEVYKPMINICKTAFPDNKSCSFKFQKTAKCYNPDILIPSLECAIEFKYGGSE